MDKTPLEQLSDAGHTYNLNPKQRKLLPEETAALAAEATAIIAGIEDLNPLVKSSQKLKFIWRLGVGLEKVPFQLCKEKGIKVIFTPNAVTPAIAELTISLMLSAARNIPWADRLIRTGHWQRKTGLRIGGSTIGLVGFGRVGQ